MIRVFSLTRLLDQDTVLRGIAHIAVALGGKEGGNLVYANTQFQAEEVTKVIVALRQNVDLAGEKEISDLVTLIKRVIHPSIPRTPLTA